MFSVRPWRWKFWEKKKTVPVDAAVGLAGLPGTQEKTKPVKICSFFHCLRKHGNKKLQGPIPTTHEEYQLQHPPTGAHNSSFRRVTSNFNTQTEQATQKSHPGSHELGLRSVSSKIFTEFLHKKPSSVTANDFTTEFDLTFALVAVAMVLAMLLVCGRTMAILWVCTWFYFLPLIRATLKVKGAKIGGKNVEEIDVSQKEHKKTVVLKGFLERDPGRQLPLRKQTGVH